MLLSSCLWLLCTLLINSLPSGSAGPAVNSFFDSPETASVGYSHELPPSTQAPAKDSVPLRGSEPLSDTSDQIDSDDEGDFDDAFDLDITLMPPVLVPRFIQLPLSLLSFSLRFITFPPLTPPPEL